MFARRPRLLPLSPAALLLVWAAAGAAAELEGVVLDNLSGRPLARAQISLEMIQGGASAPLPSVLSDSRGRFAFHALPAGAYLLSARRAGYLTARYGQRRWDGAGAPLVLDAEARFFAQLRLRRLGVITGQVLDENQLGLAGHSVYAYRAAPPPLRVAAAAVSDDRGVYRIIGLEPGRYYVRTGPRQLEDGRGLLPTFYGQSAALGQARPVDAELDRETGGVDIEPLAGRLARLAGRVLGGPATVTLYSEAGRREIVTGADGAFQFEELAPGPYQLLALTHAERPRAAWLRLTLSEGGAETTLAPVRLPSLSVRCQEKSGLRADPAKVTVFLRRVEPPEGETLRLEGGESVALTPGEYQAAAVAAPEYYIESLRLPRAGALPGRFEALPADNLELTVVLGSRPAGLSGRVLDAEGKPVPGAPVFLSAVDPALRTLLEGGRSTRADQHGEYRFYGLPPGRYRLLSSFDIARPEESDWDAPGGAETSLEEGRAARLDLKLAGGL